MTTTINTAHPAERVQAAFSRYCAAVDAHAEALKNRLLAKATLDDLLAVARIEGRIEGKNEGDREAHARLMFPEERNNLEAAERALIEARAELDKAKAELQTARDVASLTTGIALSQVA